MAKKEPRRSRPKRIMVAFTAAELASLEAKAKKVGLQASVYLRQLAITSG